MGILDFLIPHQNRIKGNIGYYGFSNWWNSAFKKSERKHIINECRSYNSKDWLTSEDIPSPSALMRDGTYWYYYKDKIYFLLGIAEKLNSSQDEYLSELFVNKALEIVLREQDIYNQDTVYSFMVSHYYRKRENPKYFDKAMWACKQQIKISSEVAEISKKKIIKKIEENKKKYKKNYREESTALPVHTGFKQLAIVFEKQKKFRKSINLCTQANEQGWAGDWKKRIDRCKKKQIKAKQRGTV